MQVTVGYGGVTGFVHDSEWRERQGSLPESVFRTGNWKEQVKLPRRLSGVAFDFKERWSVARKLGEGLFCAQGLLTERK